MPFEDSLAVRVTERHADGVTVELAIREEFINAVGILHGGVIAALADEAAWHGLNHHYGDRACTTTELKVNYLRPVTGDRVSARVRLVQTGKTLCVSQIDMSGNDGKLAALAVVTYMLLPVKTPV
ncbi:MAG: PaaI family thioesterase [Bryobacteraceae bacterium]